ncbi:hypothetical protein PMI28_05763 [Pseudomonas sp. GM48]|nr:hypothetical protein PMI28_05763 [Pseudomonas sp. GM48]
MDGLKIAASIVVDKTAYRKESVKNQTAAPKLSDESP